MGAKSWWGSLWPNSKTEDPLANLDPKLREYLKRESPVKLESDKDDPRTHEDDDHRSTQKQPPQSTTAAGFSSSSTTTQPTSKPVTPLPLPPEYKHESWKDELQHEEGLGPNGRYAHLWKTYRPIQEIENETKTDQERIVDVLEAFKDRRREISRAALENCAEEQLVWRDCMYSGTLYSRFTLCRNEVRKFEKCFNAQQVSVYCYYSTYYRACYSQVCYRIYRPKYDKTILIGPKNK